MEDEAAQERSTPSVGLKGICTSPSLRKPLAIAIVLHLSQQLCGINGIFYYSTELFKSVGLSPENAVYASIGTSAFLVVSTLVSVPLMERAGRRTLMLVGLGLVVVFIDSIIKTKCKGKVKGQSIAECNGDSNEQIVLKTDTVSQRKRRKQG